MDKLINLLKEETRQLKIDYIEKTVVWADKDFDSYIEKSKWNEERWAKYLGVPTEERKDYKGNIIISLGRNFYNTKAARVLDREKSEIRRVLAAGKAKYIETALKEANDHYEDSVHKLADRIVKKNMNTDMISVKSSYINHNLEATFTDGEKTVRAFTVLAFGPIQRPHYRYLIK